MHEVGESFHEEIERLKRERDEARKALRALVNAADHWHSCDGGINCSCGLTVALLNAEAALLPEKQTEGK